SFWDKHKTFLLLFLDVGMGIAVGAGALLVGGGGGLLLVGGLTAAALAILKK
ncbi:unnamed protein product, partial [Adineta steineri]